MSVWCCVPSKRPAEHVAKWAAAWRAQGYKIALYFDESPGSVGDSVFWKDKCDTFMYTLSGSYPGYAAATNSLIRMIAGDGGLSDPEARWFVIGGDDVYPDPLHTADEIAAQCEAHFFEHNLKPEDAMRLKRDPSTNRLSGADYLDTFGVMQPTGHRFGENPNHPDPAMRSAYIDRVAGSAWIGREFAERMNKGAGPLHPGFTHMFGDECLRACAVKLGVYWERRDLTHFHDHWGLPRAGEKMGQRDQMPEFLEKWNTPGHWKESKALFDRLKADDFRECMPL